MKPILEVKKLTKHYGNIIGIKDVSFSLNEGEIFGFIGPNGAGKSTTIRTILNLINKSNGEVYFKGKKLHKDDINLKSLIGYLPSEINLYEDLIVKEMLDFHESYYSKDIHQRRIELVKRFNLDENKKIEELSLGNLKKLGIILSLMHEPELLILDEPTSGLDPIMQEEFFGILKEEKAKGTTIFYSSHVLSEISKICDRVGIIKSGKLLQIEPVKELIEKNLTYITITSKDIEKIVKDLKLEDINIVDNTVNFKNTLDPNLIIKKLAKYEIDKLLIEAAPIEDIFMHYYK